MERAETKLKKSSVFEADVVLKGIRGANELNKIPKKRITIGKINLLIQHLEV